MPGKRGLGSKSSDRFCFLSNLIGPQNDLGQKGPLTTTQLVPHLPTAPFKFPLKSSSCQKPLYFHTLLKARREENSRVVPQCQLDILLGLQHNMALHQAILHKCKILFSKITNTLCQEDLFEEPITAHCLLSTPGSVSNIELTRTQRLSTGSQELKNYILIKTGTLKMK